MSAIDSRNRPTRGTWRPVSEAARARHRTEEARGRVSRQRRVLKSLRDDGHDTTPAESLLKAMLETLKAFEDDQRRLEDERYSARSEPAEEFLSC